MIPAETGTHNYPLLSNQVARFWLIINQKVTQQTLLQSNPDGFQG